MKNEHISSIVIRILSLVFILSTMFFSLGCEASKRPEKEREYFVGGVYDSAQNQVIETRNLNFIKYWDGEHALGRIGSPVLKLNTSLKGEGHLKSSFSGGLFFINGRADGDSKMDGQTKQVQTLTFAWLTSDGIYKISTFPLEDVSIKINAHFSTPSVHFKIVHGTISNKDMMVLRSDALEKGGPQRVIDEGWVAFPVITLPSKYWSQKLTANFP